MECSKAAADTASFRSNGGLVTKKKRKDLK